MKKVLIVVDMQNDFIDGSLGTAEAVAITGNVEKMIKNYDGGIIFTRDTHTEDYINTREGRNLPVVHCIEGSEGWEICSRLGKYEEEAVKIFNKPAFGSVELGKYLSEMEDLETVDIVGLCTDICVISNAILIKSFVPEAEINVYADCCAGVTPESHRNALYAMKMCQINIVDGE